MFVLRMHARLILYRPPNPFNRLHRAFQFVIIKVQVRVEIYKINIVYFQVRAPSKLTPQHIANSPANNPPTGQIESKGFAQRPIEKSTTLTASQSAFHSCTARPMRFTSFRSFDLPSCFFPFSVTVAWKYSGNILVSI